MTLVIGLAVLFILVGFIRALLSRGASEDAPDETAEREGFDAQPEGSDAQPEDAPGDGSPPEDPDRVSAPPWEAYPDAKWELRDVKPATWLGGASPTMMEMFKPVPEVEPDAPADGWVMPEPDPALMENPEDYGIDNGDPDEPLWTPPEPPTAAAQPEEPPRKWGAGFFGFACAVRAGFDALYLLKCIMLWQGYEDGLIKARFKLDIPGGLEAFVVAAGALLLMDILVLTLFARQSRWIKAAFLVYLLFDMGLRVVNLVNGVSVGGDFLGGTLFGVALASAYDLACGLYILRPGVTLEASD